MRALGMQIGVSEQVTSHAPILQDMDGEIEDLTYKPLKRFISGVSNETKVKLKYFALNDGKTTINTMTKEFGEFSWAGFQSGVTRRLRTITNDSDATLFDWDDSEEEWEDCNIWISKITTDSLRRYFSIEG
jgi:hypothetical protein